MIVGFFLGGGVALQKTNAFFIYISSSDDGITAETISFAFVSSSEDIVCSITGAVI